MMRFVVESWAPEYGVPVDTLDESEVSVDLDVEVALEHWEPLLPSADPASSVLFVDGVRRVDANVWIDDVDGGAVLGLCATYAAGTVRADGDGARLVACEVGRGLFTSAPEADDVVTRHGTYRVQPTQGTTPAELWLGPQRAMAELEGSVAARSEATLVIADGPLSHGRHRPGVIGYIKSQHTHYLPPSHRPMLAALPVGRRLPMFLVDTRLSWYLRLAQGTGPLGGIVRCEVSGHGSVADTARLADLVTVTLPRFASAPHKDSRAPQNLYPIGGLEQALRRRLGDQRLMERALRVAATG